MIDESTVEKVADEYRQSGYEVIPHPRGPDIPTFLNGFAPDLIARKGSEGVIFHVTSRAELAREPKLSLIADDVNRQPGWRLDLLMTGEDAVWPEPMTPSEEPRSGKIASMVDSSRRLIALGETKAACLVGWAAIEASMRAIAAMDGIVLEYKTPGFVLKTLYSQGVLSRHEFLGLERVMRFRNVLAHGLEPVEAHDDASDISQLVLDYANRLLALASRTAA